ncbi:MAG: hypothetical protein SF029_00555 [bacterium]|nr:hypothetical protein [bacterium]
MKQLLMLTLALLCSGCGVIDLMLEAPQADENVLVEGRNFAVIFTGENAAEQGLGYEFNEDPEAYWTPSPTEVAALEAGLSNYLQSQLRDGMWGYGVWERLPAYGRQYFGLVFEGERLIFANYFCNTSDEMNWQEQYVLVMDGGDCFFRLLYNPVTGEYSNLIVNGEA